MKSKTYLAALAFAFVVTPLIGRANDSSSTVVMQHGAQIMPFD
ncbi:MAG: hypothetical protein WA215_08145 [Candidatus Cybelea sp.]